MKAHIQKRRRMTTSRYFLTRLDMAECKRLESISHSRAKRAGVKLEGFNHYPCGCGADGCVVVRPIEPSGKVILD